LHYRLPGTGGIGALTTQGGTKRQNRATGLVGAVSQFRKEPPAVSSRYQLPASLY